MFFIPIKIEKYNLMLNPWVRVTRGRTQTNPNGEMSAKQRTKDEKPNFSTP